MQILSNNNNDYSRKLAITVFTIIFDLLSFKLDNICHIYIYM